jgi:hypothetical protein
VQPSSAQELSSSQDVTRTPLAVTRSKGLYKARGQRRDFASWVTAAIGTGFASGHGIDAGRLGHAGAVCAMLPHGAHPRTVAAEIRAARQLSFTPLGARSTKKDFRSASVFNSGHLHSDPSALP